MVHEFFLGKILVISPQAWGCTLVARIEIVYGDNLPTSVGMYRYGYQRIMAGNQSPHKRGDVPCLFAQFSLHGKISPQAWGCTEGKMVFSHNPVNLPTSVGMYRSGLVWILALEKSPHKRGDVPASGKTKLHKDVISPQAWGCTVTSGVFPQIPENLPTSVGMYRAIWDRDVFNGQSPHKRGDVPPISDLEAAAEKISPQAWGCTDPVTLKDDLTHNLPTSVGMYRTYTLKHLTQNESPHKRGDVPFYMTGAVNQVLISPQAWGCTFIAAISCCRHTNLPTSVGMYRARHIFLPLRGQSPHKRGDVPLMR